MSCPEGGMKVWFFENVEVFSVSLFVSWEHCGFWMNVNSMSLNLTSPLAQNIGTYLVDFSAPFQPFSLIYDDVGLSLERYG